MYRYLFRSNRLHTLAYLQNRKVISSTELPNVTRLKVSLKNVISPAKTASKDKNNETCDDSRTVKMEKEKRSTQLPPSIKNVRQMMNKFKNSVVLTQMGSFYELYFEQATEYAPKLNITLTSKTFVSGKVPFAGFPVQQLNRYLKVLVNEYGYSVVVADQYKKQMLYDNDPNKFQRRVTRIVTPGTFIDEAFENFKENAYLLNIEFPDNALDRIADDNLKLGLCWCDVSTGEIFVQQVLLKELVSTITRIQPKEILLKEKLSEYHIESGQWYSELVELKKYFINYHKPTSIYKSIDALKTFFSDVDGNNQNIESSLNYSLQSFEQKEITALRNILQYIDEHFPNFSVNLQLPKRQTSSKIMQIDSRTSSALELHVTTLTNSKKGSLLSAVRRTITPIGTRLLTQWLSGPSMDLDEIKNRQKIVKFFIENNQIALVISTKLKKVIDLSRSIQKFSFGGGNVLDVFQMAKSLESINEITKYLRDNLTNDNVHGKSVSKIMSNVLDTMTFDETLIKELLDSLNEDEINNFDKVKENENADDAIVMEVETSKNSNDNNNSSMINPTKFPALQKLYNELDMLHKSKIELEKEYVNIFVKKLGAKRLLLKQRQNKEYGIQIFGSNEVLNRLKNLIQQSGIMFNGEKISILHKSTQSMWCSNDSWNRLSYGIENMIARIKQREESIITSFKETFIAHSNRIRAIDNSIGYIDVLMSFARLAREKNLVCPEVDNSNQFEIINGRHLMVEDSLALKSLEKFVGNDCQLSNGNMWIITGPNMGGKSTFLRQNAIIAILAQIGCFVPCTKAHIGLVDKIFSRLGSADDLYNDMSTFMVEMIETSFILRGATDRSLAILDEIGRGTSGKEGLNIAFAVLIYLLTSNKCRTLFATHFGKELQAILLKHPEWIENKGMLDRIHFYKTNMIDLPNGQTMYDYRLKKGVSEKSDALNVAKLAGFPQEVIQLAQQVESVNK